MRTITISLRIDGQILLDADQRHRAWRIVHRLEVVRNALAALATAGGHHTTRRTTMPPTTLDTVDQALDAFNRVTNELATNLGKVQTNDAALHAEILALQAGSTISQEDIDSMATKARASVAALQTLSDLAGAIAADAADPVPDIPPVDLPDGGAVDGSAIS